MLITRRLVILNIPKSGSSFVRAVVRGIHARRAAPLPARWARGERFCRELMLPNVRLPGRARDQHGIAAQIPPRYRERRVVAVLRDPFAKLVSDYRFRWWAAHPPLPADDLARLVPGFPDLDFDAFLRLGDAVARVKARGIGPADIGTLTVEFVQFLFRDPAAVLARLSDSYVASGAFRADMVPATLLRQDRLADELADLLALQGYSAAEVSRARAHAPVNVTPGTADAVAWSEWGIAHVRHRERHLLAMLAALGFAWPEPVPTAAG